MSRMAWQSGSLTQSALWLTLAKGTAFCVSFLLPVLLVRQMSQTEFGLYKQVFLAVSTMVSILPLGFVMSAFYFLPREPSRQGEVILNIVIFYLFVGAVSALALFFYPGILAALFDSPELTDYGRAAGAVVFFWVVSSFIEMAAVARGEVYGAALFVVGLHLSRAFLLLATALWAGSLRSLIYVALLHGVLQTGVLWFYLVSRFPGFWRRLDGSLMRAQFAYGLPLGAAGLLWMVQTEAHNYFISHRFGPAAYAVYAIGCLQIPLAGILRDSVGAIMISRVSELRKEGDVRGILFLTARMMRKLALLLLPMYAFFFVTRREVIVFLFTDQYLASAPLFAISLSMLPLSILSAGNDPVLRAYPEHLRFLLAVRVVMVGFLLAGLWFGTAYFGLEGAIMAVVGVGFSERVVLTLKVSRVLGASCRDLALFRDVGKVALASLAAAAAAAAVREWAVGAAPSVVLLSCGLAFAAAYVAAILSLRILAPEEVEFIRRRVVSAERWMDCINTRGDHRPSGGLPLLLRRRIGFRRLDEGKSETDG